MQIAEEITTDVLLDKLAISVEHINAAALELSEATRDLGNSIITMDATDLSERTKAVLLVDRKNNRFKLFCERRPSK